MKYRLKLRKGKYIQGKIDRIISINRKRAKDVIDVRPEDARLFLSSLKIFELGSKDLIAWVDDESHPLSKISRKAIDVIFDRVDDLVGGYMWSIRSKGYYDSKPMTLVWDLLSICVVDNKLQKIHADYFKGFRNGWLRCGNFQNYVGKNHSKYMLQSLCEYGEDSAYWDKVKRFIEDTE